MPFEDNLYCNFDASATKAIAGKDILLAIFDPTGTNLWAISGQQSLTINRTADSIETSSKDTAGGWKSKITGMKEWSIENEGLYVPSDDAHKALSKAFEEGGLVCAKVVNGKTKKGMFGGLATVSDYSIDAPFDDAMTYNITLDGNGALIDLQEAGTANLMPGEGV